MTTDNHLTFRPNVREKHGNIVAVTDDVLLQAQWTQWLTWNHSNLLQCGWDFNSRVPFVGEFTDLSLENKNKSCALQILHRVLDSK